MIFVIYFLIGFVVTKFIIMDMKIRREAKEIERELINERLAFLGTDEEYKEKGVEAYKRLMYKIC